MPLRRKKISAEEELAKTLRHLERVILEFPEHYKHLFHPGRSLWLHFLRGIVYGLGILIAVAIVIPFLITILQKIEWVPLIGDFIGDINQRIREAQLR